MSCEPVPSVQIVGRGANWGKQNLCTVALFFAPCPTTERLEQASVLLDLIDVGERLSTPDGFPMHGFPQDKVADWQFTWHGVYSLYKSFLFTSIFRMG